MKIRITNAAAIAVGFDKIHHVLGIYEHSFKYGRAAYFDMDEVSNAETVEFVKQFKPTTTKVS